MSINHKVNTHAVFCSYSGMPQEEKEQRFIQYGRRSQEEHKEARLEDFFLSDSIHTKYKRSTAKVQGQKSGDRAHLLKVNRRR